MSHLQTHRRSSSKTAQIKAVGSTPVGRRERRSEEIRERLFRAALDLFAQKGFAMTTVEDITEAADVGKGTFFNYFPSKDHILIAFAEMQLGKLEASVEEARKSDASIPDFLRALAFRMTAEPTKSPSIVRAILQANLSSSPVRKVMKANHLRAQELLSQIIALGQERYEIRKDLSATQIALGLRQTVFGTLLMWSLYGDASLPERMNTAFDLLWNGVAPRNQKSGLRVEHR